MNKLGGRIDCKAHSDEILDCYLGFGISWSYIDEETLNLSLQDTIQLITYHTMMPADHKLLPIILHLEEISGEVQSVRQQPCTEQFSRMVVHASASIALLKTAKKFYGFFLGHGFVRIDVGIDNLTFDIATALSLGLEVKDYRCQVSLIDSLHQS